MIAQTTRLMPNRVLFFNCDITEGTKSTLYTNFYVDSVIHVAQIMARAAKILEIPVLVSEHAPKAFGYTFPKIKELLPKEHLIYEKTQFSMLTEEGNSFLSRYPDRKDIVLYGMETHVCIQQTTLELLEKGYNVHLVADGITSHRKLDRTVGLRRLSRAGARLTTMEGIICELIGDRKDGDPILDTLIDMLEANKKPQIPE